MNLCFFIFKINSIFYNKNIENFYYYKKIYIYFKLK